MWKLKSKGNKLKGRSKLALLWQAANAKTLPALDRAYVSLIILAHAARDRHRRVANCHIFNNCLVIRDTPSNAFTNPTRHAKDSAENKKKKQKGK